MAAAFFESGTNARATFELFVRTLPANRGYLIAAGLEHALQFIEHLHFTADEIAFLRSLPAFARVGPRFFKFLATLRFSGELWAMPEGTPFFANEPVLRVTAPIIEAQLLETYLLSTITFQSMIAAKAARCVHAASGKPVVDFGARRAHGPEAGLLAARAAYIGGCAGTSNVEAGMRFGIPTFGTLAHSYIMAHDDEAKAFQDFTATFPDLSILLLDTYDTLRAVEKIVRSGIRPAGVRLDSGDLASLSREVRIRLDAAGLHATKIFVSGDLDEFAIERLVAAGAPIDSFAVGTALTTSKDAPALSGVYKLVELDGRPTAKFSGEKSTYPGVKQVYRVTDHDTLALASEPPPQGRPLLHCVMRDGKRVGAAKTITEARERAAPELARLPDDVRLIETPAQRCVQVTPGLLQLQESVRHERMGTTT